MKLLATFAIVTALALTGCTQTPTTESQQQQAVLSSNSKISVEMSEFSFSPASIRLPAGESTTVEVINVGSMLHTFTVNDLGIDVRLAAGERETITVTPEQTGSSDSLCTIENHAALGMVGTVIVE